METKNIMIVGVGGQGSLLASKLLGHLLMEQGYDVKVSEVHGMSQRGGSVVTYVRYGDRVNSPVIDKGEADYIVSFELLEAARWLSGFNLADLRHISLELPLRTLADDYISLDITLFDENGVELRLN